MSWNEPGGNKKDPWSGRDQQDNPPDMEEVLRGFQEKILGLFGLGSQGGGPDGPGQARLGAFALGIIAVLWAISGFYLVDEGSRAVITRFGRWVDTTPPGLHWHLPPPIEKNQVVNMEQQRFLEIGYRSGGRQQQSLGSVPKEALMLTKDENIIDIRLAVQYQVKDAKDYLFNVADLDSTLKQVIESAQRAVIGRNTMDFVLTEGRGQIADDIKSEIQTVLDSYHSGLKVSSVNLVDAQPPEEVQGAFEDAIKAREDEQRLKNEAESYANEVVPKARGASARLLAESEAYKQRLIAKAEGETSRFKQLLGEYEKAAEVTRERMYLDTMQEIFSQTSNVLVDLKGGNNVVYLPLDRIAKIPVPGKSALHDAENSNISAPDPVDTSGKTARSASVRGREGRGQ